MTHEELQAIKARAEAATPGPWEARAISACGCGQCPEHVNVFAGPHQWPKIHPAEATFIAHARTDVPALLAEVERLRGALTRIAGYPNAEMFTSLAPAHEMRRTAQLALVTEEERVRLLREGSWDEEVKYEEVK